MKKKFTKILSVFMAVIIISVVFLQPIAYANAVIVGGSLLLLFMGAMLVASGFTFSSYEQAQAAANHAVTNLPADLKNRINDFIAESGISLTGDNGTFQPPSAPNPLVLTVTGALAVLTVGAKLFSDIKEYLNELYEVNEARFGEAEAAEIHLSDSGIKGMVNTVVDADGKVLNLPLYTWDYAYNEIYKNNLLVGETWFDIVDGPFSYDIIVDGRYHITYGFEERLEADKEKYPDAYDRNSYRITFTDLQTGDINNKGDSKLFYIYPESKLGISKMFFYITQQNTVSLGHSTWTYSTKQHEKDGIVIKRIVLGTGFNLGSATPTNDIVEVSKAAYEHDISDVAEHASIAVPNDFINLVNENWQNALTNHDGTERYEPEPVPICHDLGLIKQSVDSMIDYLQNDVLSLPLDDSLVGYPDIVGSLRDLIDYRTKAREMVADGATDVYDDMGRVIDGVHGRICDDPLAPPVPPIAWPSDVADPLGRLIDKLKNPDIPTDPPINPPTEPPKKGKINWNVLLNIVIFDKFPFCIPKDMYLFVSMISAPPKEPVFEVDIFNGKFGDAGKIRIDFKEFDGIRKLVRNCFLIFLIISLMVATKKYIWTGGG